MQKQKGQENKRLVGLKYERLAAEYLTGKNYTIICCNYRCRLGEIDIIAEQDECTVFVEVKYKTNSLYGYPREAVHFQKQQRIRLAARFYLRQFKTYEISCRFDVIEILGEEITHIEAAF